MAFLTITPAVGSPVNLKVARFARTPDERGGGDPRRTVNGHLRGVADWVKRGWTGVAIAVDDTELSALLAVMDPGALVGISGDAVPTIADAVVQVTGEISYEPAGALWADWHFVVPFSVREA